MLNYLKKFAMEIVPSVAATIIGAYIVNHYINAKPEAPPAGQVSTVQPKSDATRADPAKAHSDARVATIPAAGVKAKGVSEKALLEQNASAEKAVVIEKPQEKSQDKSAEKPVETTASLAPSLPADPKRPAPVRAAKASPPAAQPATAAAPADASPAVEEHRDANDLARAAIDRLRPNADAPRAPAPRAPEAGRASEESRAVAGTPPAVRPLPPPIVVSAPSEGSEPAAPRYEDSSRPTPPAEIPQAIPVMRPPLDLRAEVSVEAPKPKTNVAEDMLSAAKSMFHSVLPKSPN